MRTLEADFTDPAHCEGIVEMLNSYASDPVGGGEPLASDARERLVPALRDHPTALVLLAFVDDRPAGIAVSVRRASEAGSRRSASGPRGPDGCVSPRTRSTPQVDFGRAATESRNQPSNAYTYPEPPGFRSMAVRPDPAFCDPELGAFILRYEDVRRAAVPERMILDFSRVRTRPAPRWRSGIVLRWSESTRRGGGGA